MGLQNHAENHKALVHFSSVQMDPQIVDQRLPEAGGLMNSHCWRLSQRACSVYALGGSQITAVQSEADSAQMSQTDIRAGLVPIQQVNPLAKSGWNQLESLKEP